LTFLFFPQTAPSCWPE